MTLDRRIRIGDLFHSRQSTAFEKLQAVHIQEIPVVGKFPLGRHTNNGENLVNKGNTS